MSEEKGTTANVGEAALAAHAAGKAAPPEGKKKARKNRTATQGEDLTPEQREQLGKVPLVTMKLTELRPAAYNPRRISTEALGGLGDSLLEFGLVQPVVWNRRTGNVVIGHQRLDRLLHFGVEATDVYVVDLDEIAEKRLNVASNNPAIMGDFTASLAGLLEELKAAGEEEFKALRFDELAKLEDIGPPKEDDGDGAGKEVDADKAVDTLGVDAGGYLRIYCALGCEFDIGKGRCPHGCPYCFIAASRMEGQLTKAKPVRDRDIIAAVEAAKLNRGLFMTGACIDPCIPGLEGALKTTLDACREAGVPARFSTKNPGWLLRAARENKYPLDKLGVRMAAAFWTDAKGKEAEPGAPLVSERLAACREMSEEGADVIIRCAPLFLGYYDGLDEALSAVPLAQRVVCDPFRFSMTWSNRRISIGRLLDKDDHSVERYIRRWDKAGTIYGPYHWFEYDVDPLGQELEKVKAIAHAHGMKFGICDVRTGLACACLNDPPYHCCTKQVENIPYDRDTFGCMLVDGRIGELEVPALKNCV